VTHITVDVEQLTPNPKDHPWCWKLRIDVQGQVRPEILRVIDDWTVAHFGESAQGWGMLHQLGYASRNWRRKGLRFYFMRQDHAALFKLVWHNSDV
jgi:hypothetical protein